jgi:hypothetical protein
LDPPSGLYRETIKPGIAPSEGESYRYALVSGEGAAANFVDYLPTSIGSLDPPAEGSLSLSLLAYALDAAGNQSPLVRRDYRLAPPGLDLAPPRSGEAGPASKADPLAELGEIRLSKGSGFAELSLALPKEGQLYASIGGEPRPASMDGFLPLENQGGRAVLSFQCPRGWSQAEQVYFGLLQKGLFRFRDSAVTFDLSDLPLVDAPGEPLVVQAGQGGQSFLSFPPYDGSIFYALGSGAFAVYGSPLTLPADLGDRRLSWYGRDLSGAMSERRSILLPPSVTPPHLALVGVARGELRNEAVHLKPNAPGVLRYELARGTKPPKEPGAASPLVGQGLDVDVAPGERSDFVLRYRSFSGEGPEAAGDEGGLLSFTIDREPPLPPVIDAALPAFSIRPLKASLASPMASVFYSIEASDAANGPPPVFARLDGSFSLPGRATGAVEYTVRAYAVDEAGNRSAEMPPLHAVVDIASLFVLGSAPPGGEGSRDKPFSSLDEALALALEPGSTRSRILLSGEIAYRGGAKLGSASLDLIGGFGPDWQPRPGEHSRLRMVGDKGEAAVFFSLADAGLGFASIDILLDAKEGATFIAGRGSRVSMADCLFGATAGGDLLAFDLETSSLTLARTRFSIDKASSAILVSGRKLDLAMDDSQVSAAGAVRYFGAVSLAGGSLALRTTALRSAAGFGSRLVATEDSRILIDRCFFDATGGPGFLSLGSFGASPGLVTNTRFRAVWKGSASLFRLTGTGPAFIHDSVYAVAKTGSLRFFDCSAAAPQIRNSILDCVADSGELLVSRLAPQPGDLAASCLWGFTTLVGGALELEELKDLVAYNAASAVFSAKPCVSESPEKSFVASPAAHPLGSGSGPDPAFVLRRDSVCVGAALSLPGLGLDFSGAKRPAAAGQPDIGSDELAP